MRETERVNNAIEDLIRGYEKWFNFDPGSKTLKEKSAFDDPDRSFRFDAEDAILACESKGIFANRY